MSEVSFIRQVVVFDAADISAESAFWGAMLGGRVVDNDDRFHVVIDGEGQWRIGVQQCDPSKLHYLVICERGAKGG